LTPNPESLNLTDIVPLQAAGAAGKGDERAMDNLDQEKERGITIMSKVIIDDFIMIS